METKANISFVSLGPTCVPAEILRASDLRTCTFGFDWCRSGSHHLQEFLRLGLDEFLYRHVYNPNIPLTQLDEPKALDTCTAEPSPIKILYGYQYFLNPHRNIREPSTLEYHNRAFRRMAQVVYAKDVKKVFILADYVNKQDSVFLDYKNEISEFIIKAMNTAGVQNYNLKIIRLCLVDTNKPVFSIQTNRISPLSEAFTITVDNSLDDPSTRKYMYRFVGKSILGTTLTDLTLWKA